MNSKKRLFSKRNVIILSIILVVPLLTISTIGILLAAFCPAIVKGAIFIGFAGFMSFQESLQQDRLLSKTDHQALLAECRELHKQLSVENPDIGRQEYIKVTDSELSKFPLIRRLGGRVFASSKGAVWIELGGTMQHFGVKAYTEDFISHSSNFRYTNRELVPGLWYYDDAYNRRKDYDKFVEKLLQKNKRRK